MCKTYIVTDLLYRILGCTEKVCVCVCVQCSAVCSVEYIHVRSIYCSPVTVHATALLGSFAVAISRKVSPSSNLSSRAQQVLYRMRLGTWEESRLKACLKHCSPCQEGVRGRGREGEKER